MSVTIIVNSNDFDSFINKELKSYNELFKDYKLLSHIEPDYSIDEPFRFQRLLKVNSYNRQRTIFYEIGYDGEWIYRFSGKLGNTNKPTKVYCKRYSDAVRVCHNEVLNRIRSGYSFTSEFNIVPQLAIPYIPHESIRTELQEYTSYDYSDKKCNILDNDFPIFISPKLDGIRGIYNNGRLTTRNGLQIHTMNHIVEECKTLSTYLIELGNIDGELYLHGTDRSTIQSYVSSNVNMKDNNQIEYHIFDLMLTNVSFAYRYKILSNVFEHHSFKYLRLVKVEEVQNHNDILSKTLEYVKSDGYEGTMIRYKNGIKSFYKHGRSNRMLKFKLWYDTEGTIIDLVRSDDNKKFVLNVILRVLTNNKEKIVTCKHKGSTDVCERLFKMKKSLIGKRYVFRYNRETEDSYENPIGICILYD